MLRVFARSYCLLVVITELFVIKHSEHPRGFISSATIITNSVNFYSSIVRKW